MLSSYFISAAWLHHKGRNKHHMEYWIDYGPDKCTGITGMKMPTKYVVAAAYPLSSRSALLGLIFP